MGKVTCTKCKGRGTVAEFPFGISTECMRCNGEGYIETTGTNECTECNGRGEHVDLFGHASTCIYCNGTGLR